MEMLSLLLPLALAGEATRCVATWMGAQPGCGVGERFHVEGTGANPKAAEKAAQEQLTQVLELYAASRMAVTPLLTPEAYSGCSGSAAQTHLSCFPEPELKETQFCFVVFNEKECWTGEVLNLEDAGWRALERGRKDMCTRSDAWLEQQAYQDVLLRRARCAALCEERTRVTCPP
jgi:hypothetical protein